jgi:hypothetical protein
MLTRQGANWGQMALESVATILERTALTTIQHWYELPVLNEILIAVPMSRERRCSHLPRLFRDLVFRLRSPTISDTKELFTEGAAEHGVARRKQGYSAAMMVEEARMLQISIFKSLHDNLDHIEFHLLLPDVMRIANEVDAQLGRAVACYGGL